MQSCPHCHRLVVLVDHESNDSPVCPFCHRAFVATGDRSPIARSCSQCSADLTPLEVARGTVCSRGSCQQHHLGAEAASRRIAQETFRHEMQARAELFVRQQTDLTGEEHLILAIVPVNTREIVALPEERKQAFLHHLRRVIATVQELSEVADDELSTPYSVPEPTTPAPSEGQDKILVLACAVCRGHCCRQGVEHAFQDLPSMRRIRASFPERSADELIAQFESRLPTDSYAESCVFHTDRGCNLPRAMRSDMCNRWMCAGQHRWLEELPAEGHAVGYVVATPDYEPEAVRTALVGEVPSGDGEVMVRCDIVRDATTPSEPE